MQYTSLISRLQILGLCSLVLFSACQQKSEASFEQQSPAAPPANQKSLATERAPDFEDAAANGDIFSSSIAVPSAIDSLKKFVRTADLHFRVNNAVDATLRIEDIVRRNGGFMVGSNLSTAIELQKTIPISQDSAVETTRYSIQSQLVLRVPYRLLDTTLRSIGRLSDFLDHRHVNAEDVSLQMLEEALTRLREGQYQAELAQSGENKNHPKPERARDSRFSADQARIETLKLEDAIHFSTVKVVIYQRAQIRQESVANLDIPMPKQAFTAQIGAALRAGGEIVVLAFLGLVHLWGLILLGLVAYLGWKWFQKKPGFVGANAQKS